MSEIELGETGIKQRDESNALLRMIAKQIMALGVPLFALLAAGLVTAILDHGKLADVQSSNYKLEVMMKEIQSELAIDRAEQAEMKRDIKDGTHDRITFSEVDGFSFLLQKAFNDAGMKIIVPEPRHNSN